MTDSRMTMGGRRRRSLFFFEKFSEKDERVRMESRENLFIVFLLPSILYLNLSLVEMMKFVSAASLITLPTLCNGTSHFSSSVNVEFVTSRDPPPFPWSNDDIFSYIANSGNYYTTRRDFDDPASFLALHSNEINNDAGDGVGDLPISTFVFSDFTYESLLGSLCVDDLIGEWCVMYFFV